MLRKFSIIVCALLFVYLFSAVAFAAPNGNGGVDWEHNVVKAVGYGARPANAVNPGQANLMARRAAMVDCYRNLAEAIKGVQVTSESTVNNFILESDYVRTNVNSFIQGARVINEQAMPDGTYQVTMEASMFGSGDSLAQALAPTLNLGTQKKPLPPAPEFKEVFATTTTTQYQSTSTHFEFSADTSASFTGLVIDTSSVNLERCMAPKIVDETGREIYGTMYVNPDYAVNEGIMGYAYNSESISRVRNGGSRAGAHPLVVKAISTSNHGFTAVISKSDGDRILAANQRDAFLGRCAVMASK